MKLKKLIEKLEIIVKENPKALEFDVIYSIDDEGNDFKKVYYEATTDHYDEDDREFDGELIMYEVLISIGSLLALLIAARWVYVYIVLKKR